MTQRRPTDGWLCPRCLGVYFEHTGRPLCPWCYREDQLVAPPIVREKLRRLSRRLRAISTRDGWGCWLCGCAVDPYDLEDHRASADHVLPKSLGGGNELTNLKLAHQSCNGYRSGAKTKPFAPFDNGWVADHARREALQ